ncbi:MAG: hypothetical protein GY913_32435 [Proteobacteria bacterium]|nr:hypothetical protein [Pseudomonadota bacterium]MCP4921630.1 hypothetical protein [Pseudomonadota bacterium]
MLVLWSLLACPAEQLRIELPKGGSNALSEEDIRRDLFQLDQLGDRTDPKVAGEGAARIERRLQEMHTLPGFGSSYTREGPVTCGQIDGANTDAVVVVALDERIGAARSMAPVAVLVSVAKTFDTVERPERTVVLCAAESLDAYLGVPSVPLDSTHALVTLGPMGGENLSSAESTVEGVRHVHIAGTAPDSDDRMSRLKAHHLVKHAERVRNALDGLM